MPHYHVYDLWMNIYRYKEGTNIHIRHHLCRSALYGHQINFDSKFYHKICILLDKYAMYYSYAELNWNARKTHYKDFGISHRRSIFLYIYDQEACINARLCVRLLFRKLRSGSLLDTFLNIYD